MASVIDSLPQVKRQKVIDALLAGKSLRFVAQIAGVSHTVVQDYKRSKVLPTILAASRLNAVNALARSPEQQITENTTLTRAALQADPYLARIEKHQETIDASLEDARAAKDGRTVAALIGTDLKGLELDARLTGRLDASAGQSTHIIVLTPQASINLGGGPVVDVTPEASGK